MTPEEKNDQRAAGPESGHELDAFLGKAFEAPPLWADLWSSVRDVFFPPKLPPLQLTSTPIPVPDRMKVKANPVAIGIAVAVNGIILVLVIYFGARMFIEKVIKPHETATNVDVGVFKMLGPKGAQAGGGGG